VGPPTGWYAKTWGNALNLPGLQPYFTSIVSTLTVPQLPPVVQAGNAYESPNYLLFFNGLHQGLNAGPTALMQPQIRISSHTDNEWLALCEIYSDGLSSHGHNPDPYGKFSPNFQSLLNAGEQTVLFVVTMYPEVIQHRRIPQYAMYVFNYENQILPLSTYGFDWEGFFGQPLAAAYWPPPSGSSGFPGLYLTQAYGLVLEAHGVGNEGIFDCNYFPGGGSVTSTILALTQPSVLWSGDPDDPLGYQPVLGDGLVELLATGQPSGTSPPCNVTASVDGPTSTMSWTVPTS
jgi:hypothetical protein